ncbi:rhamnogalacturonan acetylesterase [Paenibacillus tarimensis]
MVTQPFKFDFGPEDAAAEGYVKVGPDCAYDEERGYGFLELAGVSAKAREEGGHGLQHSFCIPFNAAFTVDVPNGNYTVSVLSGDDIVPTCTTIKAGVGRIVIRDAKTAPGQYIRSLFSVNVRNGKLKLAFSGKAPRLNALEITPNSQSATLFLAGDSTVTDQPEDGFPYGGWGQMLSLYLKHDIVVSNHAESGRSSKSFIDEGRLDVIVSEMKPNDFLFIQFGHNDQKPDEERHTDPLTTYPQYLKRYIDVAREKGAFPVLITSVHRRFFDEEGKISNTHGEYLDAVRRLAADEGVPLIDLAEKSKELFEALGEEGTKTIFLWGSPGEFMNFSEGIQDNTHFQEQGAVRIAKLVAEEIRDRRIRPLELYLRGL